MRHRDDDPQRSDTPRPLPGNDIPLDIEVVGSGPPMLVVGGIHLDHRHLAGALAPLARRATLVYANVRGAGRPPRAPTLDGVDHGAWVADLEALRQRLGLGRIVFFGHSYGGYLAQEYALRYPDAVRGLILACTASALDHFEASVALARARATDAEFAALMEAFSGPLPDDDAVARLTRATAPVYFADRSKVDRIPWEELSYNCTAFNHGLSRCLPTFDVRARLADIATPALVIAGRHDWIAPPVAGEPMRRGIPGATYRCFEESGHFPMAEEPEAFTRTVSDWLDSLPDA